MRPDRFTSMLTAAINADGQMTAKTYAESGITRSLWGVITAGPAPVDIQVAARSALGDDYSQPEHVVTGTPLPNLDKGAPARMGGSGGWLNLERYFAALVVEVAAHEIASVYLYGLREKPSANHGATITFHDGSAIFMYINEKDHGRNS